jgi:hypothetical protein
MYLYISECMRRAKISRRAERANASIASSQSPKPLGLHPLVAATLGAANLGAANLGAAELISGI